MNKTRKRFLNSTGICAILIVLLISFSLLHAQQATHKRPVEIIPSSIVKHTEFQSAIARFEARLARDAAEDGIGSISAGVVAGSDLIWAGGFGWADVEKQIPADAYTIYRTGSISKSFTAVLMAQMIEKELFELDDPVEDYFPEIRRLAERPADAEKITFRHLASHTAGLTREPRLEGAASGPIRGWEDKILASIPNTYYQARPGDEYSYSNIGFGMLGLAVSRAAGTSFMFLIEENIFSPLEMNSSFFILEPQHIPHLATGYVKRRDDTVDAYNPAVEHAGRGYKVPNGGIYSTVGDLAKFIAAMTGASKVKIFSEMTLREILKQQTPEGGSGYGLGFSISIDDDGFTTIGHGGSVAGYNAHIRFELESKTGVVILRNYNGGKTNLGRTCSALLKELVNAKNK